MGSEACVRSARQVYVPYYLRARYYDPSTGQFASRDQLSNLTRQPYSYAADNPVNESDPSGLFCVATGVSGSADIGLHAGAGGQGGIEKGACSADGFQEHTWATYGGFAGYKESNCDYWGGSYPNADYFGAWGFNAGVGPALTISNANGPQDFEGPFQVTTFNVGLGPLSFSLNIATSGSTWSVGGSWTPLGSPINLSATHYATQTTQLPSWTNWLPW